MAVQSRNTIKNWFKKNLKPLEVQFHDWIDSFIHKNDQIPVTQVTGLTDTLNSLASSQSVNDLYNLIQAIDPGLSEQEVLALIDALKDGVSLDGDTLNKLRGLISNLEGIAAIQGSQLEAIQTLLTSDDVNLDTIQEIVNFIKDNEADLTALLSTKLNIEAKTTEVEANAQVNDDKYITALRLGTWLTNVLNRALTWVGKQTFTNAPRFSSVTANQYFKSDGNKDLTSVSTIPYKDVDRGVSTQNITGTVVIDLSLACRFLLTITGNITSFSFINEQLGKDYIFVLIKEESNKAFTWQAGKYRFPFGNAPVLTSPTTNGSSPAKSVDIITAICNVAGRLDIAYTPDLIEN